MRSLGRWLLCVWGAAWMCGVGSLRVEAQTTAAESRNGEEVYAIACAACHASHGRGADQSRTGFDIDLPDFTDCSFSSREPSADWFAIAHSGGPARAFDQRMPAFGDALTEDELWRAVEYVRAFCVDRAWPRGELNLPRALVTEKAYPEDEAVVTTALSGGETSAVVNRFLYERRIGARSQIEIVVPLAAQQSSSSSWTHGLGDIAVGVKRVLLHSVRSGSIVSVGAEVAFPTGKEDQGLGKGTTVFEPFMAFGQILPGNAFLHAQVGAELPRQTSVAEQEGFWRLAVGQTFEQGRFGRAWSPILEVLCARELESGATASWDVLPQLQVTLSRRQHIMVNGGMRIPLTDRNERDVEVLAYFLWDWYDGGLFEGWR